MTKGYIYTMFRGADPGIGWQMSDPIFGSTPTMGACMPNIRRAVSEGDHIFVISGRAEGIKQYVVGGFEVDEKISALAAYQRFPNNRMHRRLDNTPGGNIIVDSEGNHLPLDYHDNFRKRVENYIVGRDPVYLDSPRSIEKSREQTVDFLQNLFGKAGSKPSEILGRWRRLDDRQISQLRNWLSSLGGI